MKENGLKKIDVDRETFPLDDAAIEYIAQGTKQVNDINVGIQSILNYFLRQHGLKGNWRLAENLKELVLDAPPAAQK